MEKIVYKASEIQNMLSLSRAATYKFLETVYKNKGPFRVERIGGTVRVFKESFDAWVDADDTPPSILNIEEVE